jgi:GTPase KRas protein
MGSVNFYCSLLTHQHIDAPSYSEGQGLILMYSIASRSTFHRLEMLYKSIQRIKHGDHIVAMLVGNQGDKASNREVSEEEGATLARQFGCNFVETSAKTAKNVEGVFVDLVRTLRQTRT